MPSWKNPCNICGHNTKNAYLNFLHYVAKHEGINNE